jgi:hypothetical protein
VQSQRTGEIFRWPRGVRHISTLHSRDVWSAATPPSGCPALRLLFLFVELGSLNCKERASVPSGLSRWRVWARSGPLLAMSSGFGPATEHLLAHPGYGVADQHELLTTILRGPGTPHQNGAARFELGSAREHHHGRPSVAQLPRSVGAFSNQTW